MTRCETSAGVRFRHSMYVRSGEVFRRVRVGDELELRQPVHEAGEHVCPRGMVLDAI